MECVILWRNTGNGMVGYLSRSDEQTDEIAVFNDFEAALRIAHQHPLCKAFPYQIVVLDEL